MITQSFDDAHVKPKWATFYKCTFPLCNHRRRQGLYYMKRHVVQVHVNGGRPMIGKRKLKPSPSGISEVSEPSRLKVKTLAHTSMSSSPEAPVLHKSLKGLEAEVSRPKGFLFTAKLGSDMQWNINTAAPFKAPTPLVTSTTQPPLTFSSTPYKAELGSDMQWKIKTVKPLEVLDPPPQPCNSQGSRCSGSFTAEDWVFTDSSDCELCMGVYEGMTRNYQRQTGTFFCCSFVDE